MDKINYSRKDFIKLMGLGTAALTFPSNPLFADPIDGIKGSYDYLTKNNLAQGRI